MKLACIVGPTFTSCFGVEGSSMPAHMVQSSFVIGAPICVGAALVDMAMVGVAGVESGPGGSRRPPGELLVAGSPQGSGLAAN